MGLVFDACALIDIVDADPKLLAHIARDIAPVIIATPILSEVASLSESDCESLGLTLMEPTFAQLAESTTRRGQLSEEDHLCLVIARDGGETCVTSDGALYKACVAAGVPVLRGLKPLVILVEQGSLDPRVAIAALRAIRAKNEYLTKPVMRLFITEVRTAARVARGRRP